MRFLTAIRSRETDAELVAGFIRHDGSLGSWNVFKEVEDTRVVPALEWWAGHASVSAEGRGAANAAERLRKPTSNGGHCCGPTSACLEEHVQFRTPASAASIKTRSDALAYLDALRPENGERPAIRFLDNLKRRAEVKFDGAEPRIWEHWLGCWRRS
jgi:hypothetical protein